MPDGTPIGHVAVHNRYDGYWHMLGSFELWLGLDFGHHGDGAIKCGSGGPAEEAPQGPTVLWCRGISGFPYVTLRQISPERQYQFLAIAELEVYRAP